MLPYEVPEQVLVAFRSYYTMTEQGAIEAGSLGSRMLFYEVPD